MTFVSEAFISFLDPPEDRRSGDERRIDNLDVASDRREGSDRRDGFKPQNIQDYVCGGMTSVFEEFKRDHQGELPILVISDGKKVIQAPFKMLKDWFGYDLRIIDNVSSIYVDPAERAKILSELQEKQFLRRFTRLRKANGEIVPLDLIFSMRISRIDGQKYYYTFISVVE